MTVALVRHGRTAWNLARRMQGRADIPLDAHGRAQADAAADLLARAAWDRLITSPLSRAFETAALIGHALQIEPLSDERLSERDYGVAEGMAVAPQPCSLAAPQPRTDGRTSQPWAEDF